MSSLQQMLAAASIKNYATLDPANKGANVTLSGGNLSTSLPRLYRDGAEHYREE